jgi:hypothetical protein
MRKIDWEKSLTEADVVWLRQAGFMSENQIARHQEQFGGEVPDAETPEDSLTKSALDPTARVADRVSSESAPINTSPEPGSIQAGDALDDDEEAEPDDYDTWKVSELESEIPLRNEIPGTDPVEVVGTGKDGKVVKADLIKALRLWDQINPDGLDKN